MATAQIKLRLDVNFGDPVTPEPRLVELPALRPGADSVRVLGYPLETVLAEKLVTAIELGPANARVRDFADRHTLIGAHQVTCGPVRAALTATAAFRQVELRPLAAAASGLGSLRASAYAAYRRTLGEAGVALPEPFQDVIDTTAAFVDPTLGSLDDAAFWDPTRRSWK